MDRHPAAAAGSRPGRDLDRLLGGGSALGLGDGALLARVAAGSSPAAEGAFEALVGRHGSMVARVCRGILGDSPLAEDAAQAVFLVLLRRAGAVGDPTRLAPWLHGVALRTARAARRQQRTFDPIPQDDPTMISTLPDPTQAAIARERAEILHGAIARLPRRYLAPVVLCDLEGLTHAEAAQRLDCPTATVSIRLKRARERLKAGLARHRLDFESALPPVALGSIPRVLTATASAHLLANRVLWVASAAKWKAIAAAALVAGVAGVAAVEARPGRQDPSPPPGLGVAAGAAVAPQDPPASPPRPKADPAPVSVEIAPGLMLGLPTVRDVTDFEQYTGRVAASQSVEVRGRHDGVILNAKVVEGDLVQAGQTLFEVDRENDQTLTDRINSVRNRLEGDQNTLKSIGNAASAKPTEEMVQRRVDSLTRSLAELMEEQKRSPVAAPFAGQVARRLVDVGTTVESGKTPLATIVAVDPSLVDFEMDETTFLKIRRWLKSKPETTRLPVRVAITGDAGFPREGRVLVQTGRFNPDTGTCTLHAELPNADHSLIPGLSAQIRIDVGDPHRAFLIPEAAVETDQGRRFIRVVDAAGFVQRRPIKVGMLFDGLRDVKEGVDARTWVILDTRLAVGTKIPAPGDAPPR